MRTKKEKKAVVGRYLQGDHMHGQKSTISLPTSMDVYIKQHKRYVWRPFKFMAKYIYETSRGYKFILLYSIAINLPSLPNIP